MCSDLCWFSPPLLPSLHFPLLLHFLFIPIPSSHCEGDSAYFTFFPISVTYIEKPSFIPLTRLFCLLQLHFLKIKDCSCHSSFICFLNLLLFDSLLLCQLMDFSPFFISVAVNLPDSNSLKFSLLFFCHVTLPWCFKRNINISKYIQKSEVITLFLNFFPVYLLVNGDLIFSHKCFHFPGAFIPLSVSFKYFWSVLLYTRWFFWVSKFQQQRRDKVPDL